MIMNSVASQHPTMQGQVQIKTYFSNLLQETEKSQYNPWSKDEEFCLNHSYCTYLPHLISKPISKI